MTSNSILILNGPGLADLSDYDGHTYGSTTLGGIQEECSALCGQLGLTMDFRQTDDKDEMFGWIAKSSEEFGALIINPVGYSRAASVEFEMYRSAIMLIAHFKKPVIEVHLTNIFQQGAEITKPLQVPEGDMGFVCGLGVKGYLLAIRAIERRFNDNQTLLHKQVRVHEST